MKNNKFYNFIILFIFISIYIFKINNWGLGMGIGDWGLGPIPNPQSPIPNPQSPYFSFNCCNKIIKNFIYKKMCKYTIRIDR